MNASPRKHALTAGIATALFTMSLGMSAVHAQTADEREDDQDTAAAAAGDEDSGPILDRMIVTGSRIESDSSLDAPSPVIRHRAGGTTSSAPAATSTPIGGTTWASRASG